MVAVTQPKPSGLPDYLTDPDAVLKDQDVKWRYGRAPDYSKTRKMYAETKKMSHAAGSLHQLVENLVKNWEVEASFKTDLADWRTIDRPNYTFAINGGPPQSGEHMLNVGTYNAIISPNEYYSPENSDSASSHKTFKRMMPTFAWEVLEVYSGPPQVAFRWRHWGVMKNDYVGFNDRGEKVTAKAHGGSIDIQGVTVAKVDDKVRLQRVETWFDPMEMFRKIAPQGIVNKEPIAPKQTATSSEATTTQGPPTTDEHDLAHRPKYERSRSSESDTGKQPDVADHFRKIFTGPQGRTGCPFISRQMSDPSVPTIITPGDEQETAEEQWHDALDTEYRGRSDVTKPLNTTADSGAVCADSAATATATAGGVQVASSDSSDTSRSGSSSWTADTPPESGSSPCPSIGKNDDAAASAHPHRRDMEEQVVGLLPGEGVAVAPDSDETKKTREEMSRVLPNECPHLMNRE
ncbi:putative pathogen-related protein [Phyllosticta citrichinensis]|uniref:Pathogen-related protein n=1 Tax=Phyllosticta citrichinensis TaxID=1130410 RepID=A0ABR1XSW1_9PEZI